MNRSIVYSVLVLLVIGSMAPTLPDWGFFGHRRINRLALFTLPPELIVFFKPHVEYLTEHAVDPDKRRYATKHEAPRHYIDIDHWGTYPFPEVPRNWTDALLRYMDIYLITTRGDTLAMVREMDEEQPEVLRRVGFRIGEMEHLVSARDFRSFFIRHILPQYYEEVWVVEPDSLRQVFDISGRGDWPVVRAFAVDRFSEYGILPFHLFQMQNRLTDAFRQGDVSRLLRLAAEMGHYVGDAHVPLHTTENYNGQLTGQTGIHAFWESRLPELFADESYDFFVGKAEYIADPQTYFWDVVLSSHVLLDSVLLIEKELSRTFPQDKQFCYEERLGRTIRTQCREYARDYHERLQGMVERRMRQAIHAVGSCWYTAWIDAGQPDLRLLEDHNPTPEEQGEREQLEALFREGNARGRKHE